MKQLPLFSVLIANYNNGRYLQEAIDSVLEQTCENWEVILVDDKSTDNSFEIYEKYKADSRFHIYYNEENKGCGYTKRRCAELAHGELCGFLDPDDALIPNALEVMVKAHTEHPECSLIYSTCYRYSGDRNAEMPIWDYIGAIPEESDFLIYQKKLVSHFVTFKRSFYVKTIGIDSSLSAAVDRDLYYKLEEVGHLLYIPIPLYYYRVNNSHSISEGSDKAYWNGHFNRVKSELNAMCRRMGGELYCRNEVEYKNYMRLLLKSYYSSSVFEFGKFVKYSFCYVRAHGYSLHSINHIIKIIRKI